ncbi:ATP-binding protein [Streptomyces hygroscopicus]|uniref:ATP-binding protein n=1 Tax=Streptomyces hygroscopicus TaxID=1912 RepID=UPI00244673B4|nr:MULTISPECIES: tetratricopeptide repeat protein [Streptomyces]
MQGNVRAGGTMVGDKWRGKREWLIASELAEPTPLRERPVTGATVVRPAQLPAAAPDFTGRADAVRELSGLLAAPGGAPPVLTVAGIGGIGKTALAVHVAHAARRHFPDGQLYADLGGAGSSPAEPDAVLAAFLRALGVPDAAIPDAAEERTVLYRSALADRRVLVLLDNARDAVQIRPLLPGGGARGCAALITGRSTMAGLPGSHLVDLDVMSPEEAFSLFALIVGEERAAVEREEVMDVLASCGFLPLAIRIAASRLASRRTWTVSVLARKLADERRRLDELRAGDLAVKASFELGYGQLEPAQARAFRLLGLAEGPDISLAAAAALLGLDEDASRTLLEALVDTSLLESTVPGRYRLHDLLRLYARACAEPDGLPPAERDAALSRLLDFYLATAARVYAAERPGDRTVEHLAPTTHPGLAFASSGAALEWLFTEADCLIACARQCVTDGRRRRVADLLTAALDLAESGARSSQYQGVAEAIIESARTAGDVRTEARARSTLGNLYYFTGRFEHAERELERALDLELTASDPMLASRVPNRLGSIVLDQGRREEAETYFHRALNAFRADANEAGEASALANLARVHIDKGRAQAGVELAEQALAIYQRLGASLRLANGRYTLGIALTRTGRLEEALAHLTQALDIFRETRQQLWEGMAHFRLAETHLAAGRPARAAWHAERSLAMQGLCGEWRRGSLLTVQGKALAAVGQTDRARKCWQEALTIYERLGSPEREEVRALMGAPSIRPAGPPHAEAARAHPEPPGGMAAR